jgi:hypothetical protein
MNALAEYQFDDGGFGGLAYEFAYRGPCMKCIGHALRYIYFLREKPPAASVIKSVKGFTAVFFSCMRRQCGRSMLRHGQIFIRTDRQILSGYGTMLLEADRNELG